jgi:hypothetical protein
MRSINSTVNEIFAACPELCGFSVQDAMMPGRNREAGPLEAGLYLAIAVALLDLIDEQPEAAELLRGRAFARTLH